MSRAKLIGQNNFLQLVVTKVTHVFIVSTTFSSITSVEFTHYWVRYILYFFLFLIIIFLICLRILVHPIKSFINYVLKFFLILRCYGICHPFLFVIQRIL